MIFPEIRPMKGKTREKHLRHRHTIESSVESKTAAAQKKKVLLMLEVFFLLRLRLPHATANKQCCLFFSSSFLFSIALTF